MYGVLIDQKADEIFIVASGNFTEAAIKFAADKPIKLVDSAALLDLLSLRQGERSDVASPTLNKNTTLLPPMCPKCGHPMVARTAKRGLHSGNQFYGCSQFPECKETFNISA
jgi:restriction system protein